MKTTERGQAGGGEKMDRAFRALTDLLYDSPDIAALRSAMVQISLAFELHSFAYLFVPRVIKSQVGLISNYPRAWTDYYLSRRYEQVDPVIYTARRSTGPFRWGPEAWHGELDDRQRELLEEAAHFGIRSGFTIPIHDSVSRFAAVTFAADQDQSRFNSAIIRHQSALRLLAILFHSKARMRLVPNRFVAGTLLSPREYECLEWAAKGKSTWEIGRILGIAQRTVEFHLDNVRAKLDVKTITQAVAKLAATVQVAF